MAVIALLGGNYFMNFDRNSDRWKLNEFWTEFILYENYLINFG